MSERLTVNKTYKIFIGGKFPRTESGRYYKLCGVNGKVLGNMCLSSRKDLRNSVVAARKSFGDWSTRAPYNRSQILYRIAEMLEGRKDQFVSELISMGISKTTALKEVEEGIDLVLYYSGWCDKYHHIFGTVNPVSSSHFNFSVPEPSGVVFVFAPENKPFIGFLGSIIPTIAGGNTVVVLASEKKALSSVTIAEVLETSDLPGGVVNILTGSQNELFIHAASHMDINGIVCYAVDPKTAETIKAEASKNVKRVMVHPLEETHSLSPYRIFETQEIKTTWHPIENIGGAKSGY